MRVIKPRGTLISWRMSAVKKAVFGLGAAVTAICAVTALVCGVIIGVRGIRLTDLTRADIFYAAGKRSDDAASLAASVRKAGGAGVTYGDLVIYAVYAEKHDAESVAESTGTEVAELSVPVPNAEDEEFVAAATEAVRETEKLWRAVEEGDAAGSEAFDALSDIAVGLCGMSGNGRAVALGAALMQAADGAVSAAGALRRASAIAAVTLARMPALL